MYDREQKPLVAISGDMFLSFLPRLANRHGLVTGATGTGKTVTLQTLAETFSQMGVPVFAADVKGDLSGVAAKGGTNPSVLKRVEAYKLEEHGFAFQSFPVQFWDLFGEQGAPVRATIADMGVLLLSRLLGLNDIQSSVLHVAFKFAGDESLDLVDMKDLQKLLEYMGSNAAKLSVAYGTISAASIGAIQRGLVSLEQEGAGLFFGEPSFTITDLTQTVDGKGVIHILAADKLMHSPKLYSTFLLWMLTKLFTVLPEVGDRDKPVLVFFFDEAHLLFDSAPKVLLEKVEQVVRLIRSKGVGVYFISQTPSDIPDSVLGQLGNRVQHALRAYTPKDQKALKAAAQSFRPNPAFDTETTIAELGTGEALVSFLDERGAPTPVERAFILPPQGQVGPLEAASRKEMVEGSAAYKQYGTAVDRSTAYEVLSERLQNTPGEKELATRAKEVEKQQKADEKAQQTGEKQRQKEAVQSQRFWTGLAKTVLVPVAKTVLTSIFGRRK